MGNSNVNIDVIFFRRKINFSEDFYDLWTLSDRVEGSRFVNPLLEVSPTFYENQQLFSTLDRWAYHPTHGRPISISQVLSYAFLWFWKLYFSDSVTCISLILKHIFLRFCIAYFSESGVLHPWQMSLSAHTWAANMTLYISKLFENEIFSKRNNNNVKVGQI